MTDVSRCKFTANVATVLGTHPWDALRMRTGGQRLQRFTVGDCDLAFYLGKAPPGAIGRQDLGWPMTCGYGEVAHCARSSVMNLAFGNELNRVCVAAV